MVTIAIAKLHWSIWQRNTLILNIYHIYNDALTLASWFSVNGYYDGCNV